MNLVARYQKAITECNFENLEIWIGKHLPSDLAACVFPTVDEKAANID